MTERAYTDGQCVYAYAAREVYSSWKVKVQVSGRVLSNVVYANRPASGLRGAVGTLRVCF